MEKAPAGWSSPEYRTIRGLTLLRGKMGTGRPVGKCSHKAAYLDSPVPDVPTPRKDVTSSQCGLATRPLPDAAPWPPLSDYPPAGVAVRAGGGYRCRHPHPCDRGVSGVSNRNKSTAQGYICRSQVSMGHRYPLTPPGNSPPEANKRRGRPCGGGDWPRRSYL
jgi:hypothetical protein